jgi:BASS family bile acid:Na+ symporter
MPLPFKAGLIILAACPGGTTSGMITYLFNGNVALSISFTCINSILALFTIPFVVNLSLSYYFGNSTTIHLSYIETIIQIFSVTIIPALAGVLINKYFPRFSSKVQKPLKYILISALAVVFLILFFAGKEKGGTGITKDELFNILPYALLLNLACLAWGFSLGLITRLGIKNSYTISIEASVHNTILAFLVAETLLNNSELVKPALVYAMFSFWTAVIYSIIINFFIRKGAFSGYKSKFDPEAVS